MRWSSLLGVGVEVASPGETGPTPSLTRAVLEAAGDPDAIRTHPLTLRFVSPELEAAFTEEYQRESLRHIRFAVAMALFLVAAFGLLDAVIQPTVVRQLWLIRYGIITPYTRSCSRSRSCRERVAGSSGRSPAWCSWPAAASWR